MEKSGDLCCEKCFKNLAKCCDYNEHYIELMKRKIEETGGDLKSNQNYPSELYGDYAESNRPKS